MLISYNSAVFDVVPVTVAYQQVSPPPVGRSAMQPYAIVAAADSGEFDRAATRLARSLY